MDDYEVLRWAAAHGDYFTYPSVAVAVRSGAQWQALVRPVSKTDGANLAVCLETRDGPWQLMLRDRATHNVNAVPVDLTTYRLTEVV